MFARLYRNNIHFNKSKYITQKLHTNKEIIQNKEISQTSFNAFSKQSLINQKLGQNNKITHIHLIEQKLLTNNKSNSNSNFQQKLIIPRYK